LGDWPEARFKPRRELDMTNDRRAFLRPGAGVPVLEGKHLSPWGLEAAGRRFDVAPGAVTLERAPRVAWRAVADRAMRRRLVAAWVPEGVALGNSLIYSRAGGASGLDDLLWLLAWMNGRVAEAQLRLWCANNNINMFHLLACRLPLPEQCPEAPALLGLAAALTLQAWPGGEAPGGLRARACSLAEVGGVLGAERRLDTLWRRVYGLSEALFERTVVQRTAAALESREPQG
jgi:hypothetical protein